MKLIQDQVRLIEEADGRLIFGFSDGDLHFQIDYTGIEEGDSVIIGEHPIEDQVLFMEEFDDKIILVYVKSELILAANLNNAPNPSFVPDKYSYDFSIETYTDHLIFRQTAETTVSIFDLNGAVLSGIHDIASIEKSSYVLPFDLGLTTTDYRFLTLAKINYSSFYLFIEYDLFRKEILMKKMILSLLSNDTEWSYEAAGPNMLMISSRNGVVEANFRRIPAKGRRIFTIYQAEEYRDRHLLSILAINGSTYYVHNKANGVYLSRGNPNQVFGAKANMAARFIGKHLYIAGRNTHYAYRASGQYDYLYIEGREEAAAKFNRPLNIRFFRRYGFYKIPTDLLSGSNGKESKWQAGTKDSPVYSFKLRSGAQETRLLDFKVKGEAVYVMKTIAKGTVASEVVPYDASYSSERRRALFIQEIKKSKYIPKIFRLAVKLVGKLPKKKRLVVFESFHAKQYSDNPRAIYEYMQEHYPAYRLLWSVDRQASRLFTEFKVPYLRRFSMRWFLTVPRAEYWINNVRLPAWMPKPKGTIFVQTWHGTPLKKLGLDIMEVHMPGTKTDTYQRSFANEAKKWDYLISPNPYSSEIFRRAFHFKGKLIESGYPRNDVLSKHSQEDIKRIKKKLGITSEKKLMLYAPTWRDNEFYEKGKYRFEFQFDLDQWKKEFGDEWILLTRMHYLVAENFDFTAHEGFVLDVSAYPDIRDLYMVSNLLITDYSSVFFDFAILERPMVFFMYDLAIYRDKLRGFYFDIEKEAPGPIVETEKDLFQSIKQLEKEDVRLNPAFQAFKKRFALWEDGHAAERVVHAFLEKTDDK